MESSIIWSGEYSEESFSEIKRGSIEGKSTEAAMHKSGRNKKIKKAERLREYNQIINILFATCDLRKDSND